MKLAARGFRRKFDGVEVAKPHFSPISLRAVRGKSLPLARRCSGQNYLCHQGSPPAQNRHLHCSRSIFQGRCRNAYAIRLWVQLAPRCESAPAWLPATARYWKSRGAGAGWKRYSCLRRGARRYLTCMTAAKVLRHLLVLFGTYSSIASSSSSGACDQRRVASCKYAPIPACRQLAESTLCGWRVFAEVLGARSCRVVWPRRIVRRPGDLIFNN